MDPTLAPTPPIPPEHMVWYILAGYIVGFLLGSIAERRGNESPHPDDRPKPPR